MMKNIKKSVTLKVILILVVLMAIFALVDISFWLMNMADTSAFVLGILLFTASIGVPIEILIKKILKSK